jgi:hypothetical protein
LTVDVIGLIEIKSLVQDWSSNSERCGNITIYNQFTEVTLSGNLKGREHLEELSVNVRIILELILGKQGGKMWTAYI